MEALTKKIKDLPTYLLSAHHIFCSSIDPATQASPIVPLSISKATREVIEHRSNVAKYFKHGDAVEDDEDGHQLSHYIGVLENGYDILSGNTQRASPASRTLKNSPPPPPFQPSTFYIRRATFSPLAFGPSCEGCA